MDDDMDDLESDSDLDIDSSGEIVYAMWTIESDKGLMGHLMLYPVKELEASSGEESFSILQVKSSPVLVVIYACGYSLKKHPFSLC
jgi:hypothetical protein